jgi:hypothetical protein
VRTLRKRRTTSRPPPGQALEPLASVSTQSPTEYESTMQRLTLLRHIPLLRPAMHRLVRRVPLPRYFSTAEGRATPNKSAPRRPRDAAREAVVLTATFTMVLALSGLAASASAQVSNQRLAEINRSAMEAYNNLDVEVAKRTLEDAARSAERGGSKGPALARTYANLGVVLVGGMGETAAGTEAFVRALREDPNVEPDPLVATPEVMSAFASAKRKVGSSASARATAPEPAPIPEQVPATGNLDHEPVPEQLAQTPIPVFVRRSDELEAETLKVFYRSLGMSKPGSAEMKPTQDGWAFLIPCIDVAEPTVEYFIVAEDADGNKVGNFGDPNAPVSVNVVTTRSLPAPSLPGLPPPQTCSAAIENECPPGLPGCRSGNGQLGDSCTSDDACSTGLICDDDFCSIGDRGGSSSSSSKGDTSLFLELGFGLGATYVSSNSTADRGITEPQLRAASDLVGADNIPAVQSILRKQGYDCDLVAAPNGGVQSNGCDLAVNTPGFVAVPALHFAAGYYVTPRFNVALTGRFQLSRGRGTLAGIGLGGRGEYLLFKPKPTGLRTGVFVGAMLGSVQARPGGSGKNGPFATSSNPNGIGVLVQGGLRVNYHFTKNVGLVVTPALVLALPNTLFNVDIAAGLELAF